MKSQTDRANRDTPAGAVSAAMRCALNHPLNPGTEFLTKGNWNPVAEALHLTQREVDVGKLMLEQESRKRIARRLGLAVGTVRVHIDGLFKKLHVDGQVGLALRFARLREALATTSQPGPASTAAGPKPAP